MARSDGRRSTNADAAWRDDPAASALLHPPPLVIEQVDPRDQA
jgi:hypothetical protein